MQAKEEQEVKQKEKDLTTKLNAGMQKKLDTMKAENQNELK